MLDIFAVGSLEKNPQKKWPEKLKDANAKVVSAFRSGFEVQLKTLESGYYSLIFVLNIKTMKSCKYIGSFIIITFKG